MCINHIFPEYFSERLKIGLTEANEFTNAPGYYQNVAEYMTLEIKHKTTELGRLKDGIRHVINVLSDECDRVDMSPDEYSAIGELEKVLTNSDNIEFEL